MYAHTHPVAKCAPHGRFSLSRAALVLLAALIAPQVHSNAIQTPESIIAAATGFAIATAPVRGTGEPIVKAGRLDPRLRLARCAVELEAFRPRGAREVGNSTVGVRCMGAKPWTVFVPTYVSLPGNVLVALRYVRRGAILAAADVGIEERDLARLMNGHFADSALAVGQRVKRPLRVGSVVSPANLAAPILVRRGTRVTIIAKGGGLEIRAAGKALRDGARGDLVQVRNLASKRLVEGTVDGQAMVLVRL
jgi:flagellar basal body P-ring formation protein FlgA